MLEIIVRLLPLIFFSCAIGIVLINIQAIFSYFIYVITTAFQPKKLIITTEQIRQREAPTQSFNIFSPITHLWTLIRVLFFPDVDISGLMHSRQETNSWTSSVYAEKTQEEALKIRIKTYSVADSKNTAYFRNAFEPAEQQVVSTVFATAFPSLSKKVVTKNHSASKDEDNLTTAGLV